MQPKRIVIEAVSGKLLRRNASFRVRASGAGLLLTAPVRHRPITRHRIPPAGRLVWELLTEPRAVGELLEHLVAADLDMDHWRALTVVTALERRGLIEAVLAEGMPGLPWTGPSGE